jgi:hypothetical protein
MDYWNGFASLRRAEARGGADEARGETSEMQKEDLEALTGSIRETAKLLSRIFRV